MPRQLSAQEKDTEEKDEERHVQRDGGTESKHGDGSTDEFRVTLVHAIPNKEASSPRQIPCVPTILKRCVVSYRMEWYACSDVSRE